MTAEVRVAALGDLHCTKNSHGVFQPLFAKVAESADVLLLAGDLTDYGLPDEARVLAREMAGVRVPVVAVLGNHDLESNKSDEVRSILVDASSVVGVRMTLTAPACPAAQTLPGEVARKVREVPGVSDAKVDVVWEPAWTRDRMSEAAKLQLGMF